MGIERFFDNGGEDAGSVHTFKQQVVKKPRKKLPFLERFGIYQARFQGFGGATAKDGQNDPSITIAEGNGNYFGYLVLCTSRPDVFTRRANQIRQGMIDQKQLLGEIMIKTISVPRNPRGPYFCIGVSIVNEEVDGQIRDLTSEECLAVVQSENIGFVKFVDSGERGDPLLAGYNLGEDSDQPERLFGYLDCQMPGTSLRRIAEASIADKIVCGGRVEGFPNLEMAPFGYGETLLVRDISACIAPINFFEPVINILEGDYAKDDDGKSMVTQVIREGEVVRVSGLDEFYIVGDAIRALPIVAIAQSSSEIFGVGYVKRPLDEDGEYYKTVLVEGAGKDLGKPVNADITNLGETLLAKKV